MLLLSGFSFSSHVFTFPLSARTAARCEQAGARITRMCLDDDFNGPLVDAATGRSRLPSSLEELYLGGGLGMEPHPVKWRAEEAEEMEGEATLDALVARAKRWPWSWPMTFSGIFDQPFTASCIPRGVLRLHFNHSYNQPIPAGVIPASVTTLSLGDRFDHPLDVGVLPPCLEHLFLSGALTDDLLPHVIPALCGVPGARIPLQPAAAAALAASPPAGARHGAGPQPASVSWPPSALADTPPTQRVF